MIVVSLTDPRLSSSISHTCRYQNPRRTPVVSDFRLLFVFPRTHVLFSGGIYADNKILSTVRRHPSTPNHHWKTVRTFPLPSAIYPYDRSLKWKKKTSDVGQRNIHYNPAYSHHRFPSSFRVCCMIAVFPDECVASDPEFSTSPRVWHRRHLELLVWTISCSSWWFCCPGDLRCSHPGSTVPNYPLPHRLEHPWWAVSSRHLRCQCLPADMTRWLGLELSLPRVSDCRAVFG